MIEKMDSYNFRKVCKSVILLKKLWEILIFYKKKTIRLIWKLTLEKAINEVTQG